MTKRFNVGDYPVFSITWLDQAGVEHASVTNPAITIKKYDPVANTWSTEVNGVTMTQLTGSTYYYEYDTSGETAGYDYKIYYNATIDTLNVESTESFRLIDLQATQADIRELRTGNQRIDFSIATVEVAARNVIVGMVDYMTIYTKADGASDWTSPTSTKILYLWYDSDGKCVASKESN